MSSSIRFLFNILWMTVALAFSMDAAARTRLFQQHNLVSDGFVAADHVDPNLVNPWGLAFGVTSPGWVANNGTGTATIYDGNGNAVPLVVTIPGATAGISGTPSGVVANNTGGWVVTRNGKSAPAAFIFAAEDGTISGWSADVDAATAVTAVNNALNGAVYKALTIGGDGQRLLLYVTNFNAGKVEVFDDQFNPVVLPNGFVDPGLPAGYAPFGIQNAEGVIYVTYGLQDKQKHDAVNGVGLGIVSAFDTQGNFLHRVATGGKLNAPWAVVLSPANFALAGSRLLIGNFGDGKINIFDSASNQFYGQLLGSDGRPIRIDGLWSLVFGNGLNNQPTNALFFTAGPQNESHGLYGVITPLERPSA